MKAQGNIATGKTIELHIAAGTLVPYSIVKFYGEGTPEKFANKDVYLVGWYRNPQGGLTFEIRIPIGQTFGDTVISRQLTDKVAVYLDQDDAKDDFGYGR